MVRYLQRLTLAILIAATPCFVGCKPAAQKNRKPGKAANGLALPAPGPGQPPATGLPAARLPQKPPGRTWKEAAAEQRSPWQVARLRLAPRLGIGMRLSAVVFDAMVSFASPATPPAEAPQFELILFRATAKDGPFEEVAATRIKAVFGKNQVMGALLSTETPADGKVNGYYYRVSLRDPTDLTVLDVPPVRLPALPTFSVQDGTLSAQLPDPAAPHAKGEITLCLAKIPQLQLPGRLELGPDAKLALPPYAKELWCSVQFRTQGPLLWEYRAETQAEPPAWQFGWLPPLDLKNSIQELRFAREPGTRTAEVAAVCPTPTSQILSGAAPRPSFWYLPQESQFTDKRLYWQDDATRTPINAIAFGETPRNLVAACLPPGETAPVELVLTLPPLPRTVNARSVNGAVQFTWDKALFEKYHEAGDLPPQVRIERGGNPDDLAATVNATDGVCWDRKVQPNRTYEYHVRFLFGMKAQAWVKGIGVFAIVQDTGRERSSGVTREVSVVVSAARDRLPVAMAVPQLTYEGTDIPYLHVREQIVRALLKTPGVVLLDRFNATELQRERLLAAGQLKAPLTAGIVPALWVVRVADFTRLDHNAIRVCLDPLDGGAAVKLGEFTAAEAADPQVVQERAVGPLLAALGPAIPPAKAEGLTRKKVQRIVMGAFHPVEQPDVLRDAATVADSLAARLAEALPDVAFLDHAKLALLQQERALQANAGADSHDLGAGDVLLSGRVWRAGDADHGYDLLATAADTGEILGLWRCERETPQAMTELVAWCRGLTQPVDASLAPLPPGTPPSPLLTREYSLRRLNSDFRLPDFRTHVSAWQTPDRMATLLAAAKEQWQAGQRPAAIEALEDVWLQRSQVNDATNKAQLPVVADTLAGWYHEQQEFAGELSMRQWLVDNPAAATALPRGANVPATITDPAEATRALMRAKLLAANSSRAKELAVRSRHKEAGTPVTPGQPARLPDMVMSLQRSGPAIKKVTMQVRRGDKMVTVPEVPLGLEFPPVLNLQLRREVTERDADDPLYAVRPAKSPEYQPTFDGYAQAFADFWARDRAVFDAGLKTVAKMRQEVTAAGRSPADEWVQFPPYQALGDLGARLGAIGAPLPVYTDVVAPRVAACFEAQPYTMTAVLRKTPKPFTQAMLPHLREKFPAMPKPFFFKDSDMPASQRPFTMLVSWRGYLLTTVAGELGDSQAEAECGKARELAREILQKGVAFDAATLDALYVQHRFALASAVLILAHAKDPAAAKAMNDYKLARLVFAGEGNAGEVARCLLDLGYDYYALTVDPERTWLWRSRDEVKRLATAYPDVFQQVYQWPLLATTGLPMPPDDPRTNHKLSRKDRSKPENRAPAAPAVPPPPVAPGK